MRVSYISDNKIIDLVLPSRVWGNYWVNDKVIKEDEFKNVINVKAQDGKWEMTSNAETTVIYNGNSVRSVLLDMNTFYSLKERDKEELSFIYTSPVYDESYIAYEASGDCKLKIGKANDSEVIYNNLNIKDTNNEISFHGNSWIINDLGSQFGTYVNNKRVGSKLLKNGDVVFIMGLKIIVLGRMLIINNPKNSVKINTSFLIPKNLEKTSKNRPKLKDVDPSLVSLYDEEDFFSRSPRFRSTVMRTGMKINDPPDVAPEPDRPAILVLGPMFTMSLMSMSSFLPALQGMLKGADFKSYLPSLVMSLSMLTGSFLWPIFSRKYEKKQRAKLIKERTIQYKKYIDFKRRQISMIGAGQRDSLLDNNVSLSECANIIKTKNRRLWERDLSHGDFLNLRLGLGNKDIQLNLESTGSGFGVQDNDLANYKNDMINSTRILYDVPITESLIRKNVIAIEGRKNQAREFINNLILQMITFQNYRDLKIVILTNEENKEHWSFTRSLPHCWNDLHDLRYVASNSDEMKEMSLHLEQEYKRRTTNPENGQALKISGDDAAFAYRRTRPYYVIITDNYKAAKNLQIIGDIVNNPVNFGYSLIILGSNLTNVPANSRAFISLGEKTSGLFESELIANRQKTFIQDRASYDLEEISRELANIPMELGEGEFSLPDVISFLQMYKVGMIDQLNPINRWKKNNPVVSLSVPIGVGTSGETFKLDLHERAHGPHGLIAGMTGSGKSEFIITYVLSLAINFSPDEVQFVLIDYKGGGLAGAFENRETGVKLPHLIGTITNLDVTEINRSLLSIQSELKRRQAAFNVARDKLNESTIDIYKYQKYYREGLLDEPISHLFLISDEFAELKAQQPDFMDELISTARIGRSLGVHLILSTQKPGGVVNDQIWSNSRFRVCLKVQDATDSKEMIRRPDAAALKHPGRFYLQVGYDEFFALGQSAWAGSQYIPSERVVKQIDDSLEFIDDTGNIIKSINNIVVEEKKSQGEELINILKFIRQISQLEGYNPRQLWLDRIPNEIFIDDLKEKYNYQKEDRIINPVIGEYDLPAYQKQKLLTLPLTERGNTYVVGVSGKELFFRSLIYSIASTYTPDEANMYVLDFDTEVLKMYSRNKMVGDVMIASEAEKIENFFKMVDKIKAERREILKDYNGDYHFFLRNSKDPMPLVIIMITSYETFLETYPKYDEYMRSITRDCNKYGIVFINGASAENGMRMNTARNFSMRLALEMNNQEDYRSFLGTRSRLLPSRGTARGLISVEGEAFEFQTAKFSTDELINEYVKKLEEELDKKYEKGARKVPTLPDIVRIDDVKESFTSISHLPFGLQTQDLEHGVFNVKEKLMTTVTSEFTENMNDLVQTLMQGLELIPGISIQFWDAGRSFKDFVKGDYYLATGFAETIEQLAPYLENQANKLTNANMDYEVLKDEPDILILVNEFGNLYENLSTEEKDTLNSVLKSGALTQTIHFLLIDSASNMRKYRYEDWFSKYVDNKEGVYVGNNVTMSNYQFSYEPKSLRETLKNDYGYLIKKGVATRIKFISSIKEEDYYE